MSLPALPETFRWTEEPWGAALRCVPLEPLAAHLFTTRRLALATPDDWKQAARSVGADEVVTVRQVHGRKVVIVRGGAPEEAQQGDVVVSREARLALAVRAADCVPLLLADPRTGAVAAVHAGWRGTASGAAPAAVEALVREFGGSPQDLVAAIGPAIGVCCYEVGTELVDAFAQAGHARGLIDRWFAAPPPRRGSRERPRLRLDTVLANRDQLVLAGVAENNIHACGLCTACNLDLFPSYRAEGSQAGRLVGIVRANAGQF